MKLPSCFGKVPILSLNESVFPLKEFIKNLLPCLSFLSVDSCYFLAEFHVFKIQSKKEKSDYAK